MIAVKERQRQPADVRPVSRSGRNGQGTNALPFAITRERSLSHLLYQKLEDDRFMLEKMAGWASSLTPSF